MTTSYVLEFSLEGITSCIPFDFKIRDKERDLHPFDKEGWNDLKVVGYLNHKDLAFSKRGECYLFELGKPPKQIDWVQNESLTELCSCVLLQNLESDF